MRVEFCARVCLRISSPRGVGAGVRAESEGRPPRRAARRSAGRRMRGARVCGQVSEASPGRSPATAPSTATLPYLTIRLYGDTTVMTIGGQHRTVSHSVPHGRTEGKVGRCGRTEQRTGTGRIPSGSTAPPGSRACQGPLEPLGRAVMANGTLKPGRAGCPGHDSERVSASAWTCTVWRLNLTSESK